MAVSYVSNMSETLMRFAKIAYLTKSSLRADASSWVYMAKGINVTNHHYKKQVASFEDLKSRRGTTNTDSGILPETAVRQFILKACEQGDSLEPRGLYSIDLRTDSKSSYPTLTVKLFLLQSLNRLPMINEILL